MAARNGVSGTHMLLWLPHFHDFCLTVGILGCGMKGYPLVLMSPLHFIAKPTRWLDFMARHKTSHTVGPDFAFGLLSRSAPSHLIPNVTPDLLHSKEVCCFVQTSQQRMLLSHSSSVLGALLRSLCCQQPVVSTCSLRMLVYNKCCNFGISSVFGPHVLYSHKSCVLTLS